MTARLDDTPRRARSGGGRLFVFMTLLVILVACANTWCAMQILGQRDDLRLQATESLGNVTGTLANEISERFRAVDAGLLAVDAALQRTGGAIPTSAARRRALLTQGAAQIGATSPGAALHLADVNGDVLDESHARSPHIGNVATIDFFRVQRDAGNQSAAAAPAYIGKVLKNQVDDRYYLSVSRRLTADGGADGRRFAGVVFASLPVTSFDSAFAARASAVGGMRGAVALARDDGTVLARWPTNPAFMNVTLGRATLFEHYPQQTSGWFQARSPFDQIERLYAFSQVPGTSLVVAAGTALDDVYAGWYRRAAIMGVIALLATLGIGIAATLFALSHRRREAARDALLRSESRLREGPRGGIEPHLGETMTMLGDAGDVGKPDTDAGTGAALLTMAGRISHANPALCRMLGVHRSALVGKAASRVLGVNGWPELDAGLAALRDGDTDVYARERRFERSDGTGIDVLVSVTVVLNAGGRPRFYTVQVQDMTSRVQAAQAIKDQNERLKVTLSSIADGVMTTNEAGKLRFMNPAAEVICGWPSEEAVSLPITEIFTLHDAETGLPVDDAVRRALMAPRATHVSVSGVLIDRKGVRREVACNAAALRTAKDKVIGAVLVVRDVSEARELHRKLAYSASHDALTSLPNRASFEHTLEAALNEAKVTGKRHALAFLDLDRFKIVNDTAGHRAGDALLKQIARLLPSQLRDHDTVGRLGGDEFGIILRDCAIGDAQLRLEHIIGEIGVWQFSWEGRNYGVGASIGLTAVDSQAVSANALLTQADVACYAAKNAGRNGVSVYSGEQSEAADWHRKIVLAAGIEEAIAEGRIFLYAQKVLPNDEQEPARWELLARMFDRDGAPIPTSVFIPAAERYDLMGHIDRWNLVHALTELRRGLDHGVLFPVHINLSANSLNDPLFVPDALRSIDSAGIPASALTFEITETALMRNPVNAAEAIKSLRAAGIQIALDDFGIGLSSFGYLRKFPVDVIKIDGSFVLGMTANPVDRSIVRSIHQIARDIGARTVAESVENDELHAALKEMGVDFFQGYGIHRPEPLRDAIDDEIRRQHLG